MSLGALTLGNPYRARAHLNPEVSARYSSSCDDIISFHICEQNDSTTKVVKVTVTFSLLLSIVLQIVLQITFYDDMKQCVCRVTT